MPDPLDYAESDEDDLFDDPLFEDTRQPVAGPSAAPTYPAIISEKLRPRSPLSSSRPTRSASPAAIHGVASLRATCIRLLRSYASAITDIGSLPFAQIGEVLAVLAREQLVVVETNSPHVKKESDALWERYVRDDPRFRKHYIECLARRDAGSRIRWRRAYHDAEEADRVRKEQAIAKMAERYRALDEEKKLNKVVLMDRLMPSRVPRKMQHEARSQTSTSLSKVAKTLSKVREDLKREQLARTHQAQLAPPRPTSTQSKLVLTPLARPASPTRPTACSTPPKPLGLPSTALPPGQVRFRIPGQLRIGGPKIHRVVPVAKTPFVPPPPVKKLAGDKGVFTLSGDAPSSRPVVVSRRISAGVKSSTSGTSGTSANDQNKEKRRAGAVGSADGDEVGSPARKKVKRTVIDTRDDDDGDDDLFGDSVSPSKYSRPTPDPTPPRHTAPVSVPRSAGKPTPEEDAARIAAIAFRKKVRIGGRP
ncbi:hypothetical protein Q5752_000357 [Cryptotrichosporon argae]